VTRKRVIGVIPAKGRSQRLPNKNILDIAGKPLIGYTIEAARKARLLDQVIVSTDDDVICDVAVRLGARVVIRPKELARDDSPIDDAYRHTVRYLEDHEGFVPEVVVGMQANMPVRKDGEIDAVVRRLIETPWATAVATAKRISERPEWMKRLKDETTGEITPIADASTNYRVQDLPELYLLDGAIIALRTEVLKSSAGNRRVHAYLGDRVLIHVHAPRYAVEIDDHDDVGLAEYFLSSHS